MDVLIEAVPYKPARPRDDHWIERSDQQRKGKPAQSGKKPLPKGTFDKSPGAIAQALKSNSSSYKQAMSRLTNFINMNGDNLDDNAKTRLEQAKQALRRAYGIKDRDQ